MGRHCLHIAMQDQEFSADLYKRFKASWLCHNHILFVNKEGLTLRFNFPTIGQKLVKLLRSFVCEDSVQTLAFTNPNVGGFALEKIFMEYILKEGRIAVMINSASGQAASESVILNTAIVVPFDNAIFVKNTVYELYSCHPIIDYVGYLECMNKSTS